MHLFISQDEITDAKLAGFAQARLLIDCLGFLGTREEIYVEQAIDTSLKTLSNERIYAKGTLKKLTIKNIRIKYESQFKLQQATPAKDKKNRNVSSFTKSTSDNNWNNQSNSEKRDATILLRDAVERLNDSLAIEIVRYFLANPTYYPSNDDLAFALDTSVSKILLAKDIVKSELNSLINTDQGRKGGQQ